RFNTRLLEIYGSTETGQISARRPTHTPEWRLWPGVTLSVRDGETWAQGGHIEQPTRLCDVLEMTGEETFLLHGRVADLVNIAGKRSSLAYLNQQLNCIPGVLDDAFFHFDDWRASHPGVARVAACVVAPQLDAARVVQERRRRIAVAKCANPLRPGETLTLEHDPLPNGSIAFRIASAGQAVAHGVHVPAIAPTGPHVARGAAVPAGPRASAAQWAGAPERGS